MTERSETEHRILDAAREVFVRRGTAGARMQEIADEAGVNKALLHYYFDDKATLAEAVFRRAARDLFPRVIRVLQSEAPIEEKVQEVVRLELDHLSKNPFLPGYVITELHSQPSRARELLSAVAGEPAGRFMPEVLETLGAQLEQRAREGTLRRVRPEQFLINLISLCIFPFAAAPMVRTLFDLDEEGFRDFIDERREVLPELILEGMEA